MTIFFKIGGENFALCHFLCALTVMPHLYLYHVSPGTVSLHIIPYRSPIISTPPPPTSLISSPPLVSFAAVYRVVTQQSSPLTATHSSSAFLSLKLTNKEQASISGNLVFVGKYNEKHDWRSC